MIRLSITLAILTALFATVHGESSFVPRSKAYLSSINQLDEQVSKGSPFPSIWGIRGGATSAGKLLDVEVHW